MRIETNQPRIARPARTPGYRPLGGEPCRTESAKDRRKWRGGFIDTKRANVRDGIRSIWRRSRSPNHSREESIWSRGVPQPRNEQPHQEADAWPYATWDAANYCRKLACDRCLCDRMSMATFVLRAGSVNGNGGDCLGFQRLELLGERALSEIDCDGPVQRPENSVRAVLRISAGSPEQLECLCDRSCGVSAAGYRGAHDRVSIARVTLAGSKANNASAEGEIGPRGLAMDLEGISRRVSGQNAHG